INCCRGVSSNRRRRRRKPTRIASPPSVTFRAFVQHLLHLFHLSRPLHLLHRSHPYHPSHPYRPSNRSSSRRLTITCPLSSQNAGIRPRSIRCAPSQPDILSSRASSTSSPVS